MPKRRPKILDSYNLNKTFTTKNEYTYFEGTDPTEHLIGWIRFQDLNQTAGTFLFVDDSKNNASIAINSLSNYHTTNASPFNRREIGNLRKTLSPYVLGSSEIEIGSSANYTFGSYSGSGAAADTSFSISMWMKTDFSAFDPSTAVQLLAKASGALNIMVQGGVLFAIVGTNGSNLAGVRLSTVNNFAGEWLNLVWTYDATTYNASKTGSNAAAGMKLYANGVDVTGTAITNGTYQGMPAAAEAVTITNFGGNGTRTPEPDGLFEIAVWSGKSLSSEEVSALYDVTNGFAETDKIKEYLTYSGITSLPIRAFISDLDNMSGSYPTIARTAQNDGAYGTFFDDTDTILFHSSGSSIGTGQNVILGEQLSTLSPYSGTMVVAPSTVPDLALASQKTSIKPGISDSRVTFTPGQNFKPFVEHDLFASDAKQTRGGDPFWVTGSYPSDVGLGFTNPVWSKTKIEINLNPTVHTSLGSERADLAAANATDLKPMAYYNHDLQKFEVIGKTFDQYIAGQQFEKLCLGFSEGLTEVQSNGPESAATAGDPVSSFGFPAAIRYHATSSQTLSMSGSITSPFLIEKMVYYFSASYSASVGDVVYPGGAGWFPDLAISNFFILNQRSPFSIDETIDVKKFYLGSDISGQVHLTIPSGNNLTDQGPTRQINDMRELVTFAQMSTRVASFGTEGAPRALRDLNVLSDLSAEIDLDSREFIMSASVRAPVKADAVGQVQFSLNDQQTTLEYAGTRSGVQRVSGRSLVGEFTAFTPSGSFTDPKFGTTIQLGTAQSVTSPYLLLPTDELVFGWQAPVDKYGALGSKLTLYPGAGKLVLYGSEVREGKEFHPGLNQLLTSDAVHEDVRDTVSLARNSYVLDQNTGTYYTQFTGSYIDNYPGVFKPSGVGPAFARERIDRPFASSIGSPHSGSILKGVRFPDGTEQYMDSTVPDFLGIANANGNTFRVDSNRQLNHLTDGPGPLFYLLGDVRGNYAGTPVDPMPDKRWPRAFPFEKDYKDIERISGPRRSIETITNLNNVENERNPAVNMTFPYTSNKYGVIINQDVVPFLGSVDTEIVGDNVMLCRADPGVNKLINVPNQNEKFMKMFYGFGDGKDNLGLLNGIVNTDRATDWRAVGSTSVIIRGFKYGIFNALPQNTSCVFRHDVYGQFRDMMEQRPYTVIAQTNTVLPPDSRADSQIIGGQSYRAPVEVVFTKVISDPQSQGQGAQRENFLSADFSNIDQVKAGNGIRGIWYENCNTDTFSRVTKPFIDAALPVVTQLSPEEIQSLDEFQADILSNLNVPTTSIFNV